VGAIHASSSIWSEAMPVVAGAGSKGARTSLPPAAVSEACETTKVRVASPYSNCVGARAQQRVGHRVGQQPGEGPVSGGTCCWSWCDDGVDGRGDGRGRVAAVVVVAEPAPPQPAVRKMAARAQRSGERRSWSLRGASGEIEGSKRPGPARPAQWICHRTALAFPATVKGGGPRVIGSSYRTPEVAGR